MAELEPHVVFKVKYQLPSNGDVPPREEVRYGILRLTYPMGSADGRYVNEVDGVQHLDMYPQNKVWNPDIPTQVDYA